MTSVQSFILQLLVLSLVLLLGFVLRFKVRLFQRLFIPAPVLAGLVGLILGPELIGGLSFIRGHPVLEPWLQSYTEEWIPVYRLLPGVLITPVMAASVLGMEFPGRKKFVESVGKQFGYTVAFYGSQFMLGGVVAGIFFDKVYPTFGLELFAGFSGGHGTAGVYGQTLRDLNADYWELGQGVALTTATFGLLFGVVGGIALINLCARRGQTALLSSPQHLPEEVKTGLYRSIGARKEMGRSPTAPEVLEPLSYTIGLIAVPSILGILTSNLFSRLAVPGLRNVGEFAWALVFAAGLWLMLERSNLGWLLDTACKNRVAGTLVDFLVAAAILSMPLGAVLDHIVPILVLTLLGFISAVAMFYLGKRVLPDHWVERSIMTFGQCTGVAATGLLLLRIVDPDFKTPAVSSWGVSYAIAFPISLVYLGTGVSLIIDYGPWFFAGSSFLFVLLGLGMVRAFARVPTRPGRTG